MNSDECLVHPFLCCTSLVSSNTVQVRAMAITGGRRSPPPWQKMSRGPSAGGSGTTCSVYNNGTTVFVTKVRVRVVVITCSFVCSFDRTADPGGKLGYWEWSACGGGRRRRQQCVHVARYIMLVHPTINPPFVRSFDSTAMRVGRAAQLLGADDASRYHCVHGASYACGDRGQHCCACGESCYHSCHCLTLHISYTQAGKDKMFDSPTGDGRLGCGRILGNCKWLELRHYCG